MGVISTLNAGAEQIPTPPAVTAEDAAVATVAEADPKPPPTLPWGAKPQKLKIGKAGASSRTLAAQGADAALSEPGDKVAVEPDFAPKGDIDQGAAPKVAPPAPPGLRADLAKDDPNYFYGASRQFAESAGTYANLVISRPTVATGDVHSLGEIAVRYGPPEARHTVEVGWIVNPAMHGGSTEPHLFVYHWVDGKPICYNSCGFEPYSKTIVPGMKLPEGVSKRFGIEYFKDASGRGAWWIAYDSEWVGFFPDTLWQGRFTKSTLLQWYGEVATYRDAPCGTQMGNGKSGTDAAAARIGSISLLEGPEENIEIEAQNPYYTAVRVSGRTMRFGGTATC